FTSGGTEGNNLAIKGIALKHRERGKHIITSVTEHPSVLKTCRILEEFGFDVTYLPVDETGAVSISQLEKAIREDTILISIMHVNNELGSVQPIVEIAKVVEKNPKVFFQVDHVQGFGKVSLALQKNQIDICTISCRKLNVFTGTSIPSINR